MSEEMKQELETMEDYKVELEASFASMNKVELPDEDEEIWAMLQQKMEEKEVLTVAIKEVVNSGVITYVDDVKAFIPASKLAASYVEDLNDYVGRTIEAVIITASKENKRLVLSGREIAKQKIEEKRSLQMASCKVGDVVEGVVDTLQPYGAFINLENGLSGLLHISQISHQRIKHPGVLLKEGQQVSVKIISTEQNKLSFSMKALQEEGIEEEADFDYQEDGGAMTNLGALLGGLKF